VLDRGVAGAPDDFRACRGLDGWFDGELDRVSSGSQNTAAGPSSSVSGGRNQVATTPRPTLP
jgi:hypothetical protein